MLQQLGLPESLAAVLISDQGRQFIRFATIGVGSTAIYTIAYLVLLRLLNPMAAYIIAFLTSVSFSITMHMIFTFKVRPAPRYAISFAGVYLTSMVLGGVVLDLLIAIGIMPAAAGLIVIIAIMFFNFFGMRIFARQTSTTDQTG